MDINHLQFEGVRAAFVKPKGGHPVPTRFVPWNESRFEHAALIRARGHGVPTLQTSARDFLAHAFPFARQTGLGLWLPAIQNFDQAGAIIARQNNVATALHCGLATCGEIAHSVRCDHTQIVGENHAFEVQFVAQNFLQPVR